MTPEKWDKVSEIFHAAVEKPAAELNDFLDKACGRDKELRTEVLSLLAANDEAGDFIKEPAVDPLAGVSSENKPASLSGASIGPYQVKRSIGSGGMGNVYLATDTRLNRDVAVKSLPPDMLDDAGLIKRFENEAKAAAAINHPNVATIFTVEKIDDRPLITMEFVDGTTLDELIPENGVGVRLFLEWFVPITDALSRAHESGIIHRDIKPGNIMITRTGTPKILDFGLARFEQRDISGDVHDTGLTHSGQILGTPAYMSPEQAEGNELDQTTDIFSLGVVMYQALTGKRPFPGDNNAQVVSNLLRSDPEPINRSRPDVPSDIVRLTEKCLSKSRRSRPASMAEVNKTLAGVKARLGGDLSTSSSLRRFYREFRTGSPSWLIAAGVFVLLAAVAASFLFRVSKEDSSFSTSNITPRQLSQTNNIVYAHITPDGNSMVYNTIEENERRAMWIRRIDDRNSLRLLEPQDVWFWGGLAVSPDNSHIYYVTAERTARHGSLYRISSLGGQPRKLADTVNDLGSLSPDGSRVLLVRYGDVAQLISVNAMDGGDEQVILSGEPGDIFRDPAFSADGSRIYYSLVENVGGREMWSLAEIPATGGTPRTIMPAQRSRINEVVALNDGSGLLINQIDANSNLNQIFHLSPTGNKLTKVTNDLNSYFGLSVSADGRSMMTARRQTRNDLWAGRLTETSKLEKITAEPIAYRYVTWTPDNKIVFEGIENNVPHIFITDPEGGDLTQMTFGDRTNTEPAVSPDGKHLIFTSDRSGERKIWRMNPDGSSPSMLGPAEGTGLAPRFLNDSSSVIFRWNRDNTTGLAELDLATGDMTPVEDHSNSYWRLSPDGSMIAAVFYDEAEQRAKVRLKPLKAGIKEKILDIDPFYVFLWSADSRSLIYRERDQLEGHPSTLWAVDIATGNKSKFLSAEPDAFVTAAISPDGSRIAVIRGTLLTDAVLFTRNDPAR
ncbi:MAG: serine/threonine-protein kinase [Acidobacteria bacterium]|nr:serine/threonine-protein kinase [Acidobacteriota bacterium]